MTTQATWLLITAILITLLIPIMPHLMRLRISVLRWLHLNWFAELHENHFKSFTIAARSILAALALVLYYLALF